MQRVMLKSKIHRATVTDCDLHYVGSITIDRGAARGRGHPRARAGAVLDIDNGARLRRTRSPASVTRGEIKLNGAAARLVHRGDTIIVISYAAYEHRGSIPPARVHVQARRWIPHRREARPDLGRPAGSAVRRPKVSTTREELDVQPPEAPATDASDPGPLPMTLPHLAEKKRLGDPIVMVTAYDFPSGSARRGRGPTSCSSATRGDHVVLGYSSTLPAASTTC